MRNAFSDALVAAARKDARVLLLTGDHGYTLFDSFRKHFPERFLNAGVAEPEMDPPSLSCAPFRYQA